MRNVDEIMLGRPVEEVNAPTEMVLIEGRSVELFREVCEAMGYNGALMEYCADRMSCMYER